MNKSVLIVNGPNLNLLGSREPQLYGSITLEDIKKQCLAKAKELKLSCEFFQSNSEGEIVDRIQEARANKQAIIINAGAYTHTSVAIRDALLANDWIIIEVHISNIFKREDFRHKSLISDIAHGMICGLGTQGYELALDAVSRLLER